MNLMMFVDPIEGLHGPLRPAYLLARELRGSYDVTFVISSPETAEAIRLAGLNAISLNKRYLLRGSLRTLEARLRNIRYELGSNNDDSVTIKLLSGLPR